MSTRKNNKARTRQRILDEATKMFNEIGYEETNLRELARRCNCSTGAIFNCFDSKVELYRTITGHNPVSVGNGRELLLAIEDYFGVRNLPTTSRRLDRMIRRSIQRAPETRNPDRVLKRFDGDFDAKESRSSNVRAESRPSES